MCLMHTAFSPLYFQKRLRGSVRPSRLLQDSGNTWILFIFEAILHLVGRVSNCFSLYSNSAFCFRSLPAPNAAGKLLILECMWNMEPLLKFVQIFCVCGRGGFPLPAWQMRCGGLADRAFEWGFRMLCWWRDSWAHVLCQPSPRGFAVCVPKWHFWLMLSAASLLARQRNWGKLRTC